MLQSPGNTVKDLIFNEGYFVLTQYVDGITHFLFYTIEGVKFSEA